MDYNMERNLSMEIHNSSVSYVDLEHAIIWGEQLMKQPSSCFSINYLKIIGLHNKEIVLDLKKAESYTPIYFIGHNGSYKSTVLEIIYAIFASYDAPSVMNDYEIDYYLEYTIHGRAVSINKKRNEYDLAIRIYSGEVQQLKAVNIGVLRRKLKKAGALPLRVISFYAGENDRIQKMSKHAMRGYKVKLNREVNDLIKNKKEEISLEHINKRYFHGDNELIPLLLIKAIGGREHARTLVKEKCHVESLIKITFSTELVLKGNKKGNKEALSVNETKMLLLRLFPEEKFEILKSPSKESSDYIISYDLIEEIDELSKVYKLYDFIASAFDGTTRIYMKSNEESNVIINDTQLSQGQRQWIKIIGLLSLVNDGDNLVLMDEPDAFMNPVWKYEFHETINAMLGGAAPGVNLIVTHDPLLINGVPKEQIRIFEKTDNEVLIQEPKDNTYGLGIDGILRSSYYGLATTYDQMTSEKYYRRMFLYSKAINNELTDKSEKRELYDLTKDLGSLPVFNTSIDYLYLDFLKAYEESELSQKKYLTSEEVKEKQATIEEILRDLFKEYLDEIH